MKYFTTHFTVTLRDAYKEIHIGIVSESVCKEFAMEVTGPEFRLTEPTPNRGQLQDSRIPASIQ